MFVFRAILFLCCILSFAGDLWALAKTRGVPLGGIGTGYIKYDARTGDFATGSKIPPPGSDMACEFPVRMSNSSGFHFFAGGEPLQKAKTDKEDAKLPLYSADFGKVNNVSFTMNAFGPTIPAKNAQDIKLPASPIALFEITAKNEGSSVIDVAVALEFQNKSSSVSGLLGGTDNGTIDPESGNRAISFSDATFSDIQSNPNNSGNSYIFSGCNHQSPVYSAGALGTFLTTGILSNSDGNCVAAKCTIGPGESFKFKFIISWWRTFVSGTDMYNSGKNDDDNYYYHNFYQNSKEAALFGMENFDKVRDGILSMVQRVMASNFPEWYIDRLLNNCYPLIHNSVWTKDGRAAYWEGLYGILGTIDQGQHAAIWYMNNWPHNQWSELQYWLRNMWKDPNMYSKELLGQIHHDFNVSPANGFIPAESRFMTPWDHFDRQDYFWDRDATDWSDLNAMLIFKAYELMVTTGDIDSIKVWFPKILLTAERLYRMAQDAGSYLPITSSSSYDSDHTFIFPEYVSGTAIVAYKAMAEIAKVVGDDATAARYGDFFEKGKKEFKERFDNETFGTVGGVSRLWHEGNVGGYSWANYFCFEPIMEEAFIKNGCNTIWDIYDLQTDPRKKLGTWHLYTYDHFGGALTAINKPDSAMHIHKLDHALYYENLPDLVFWQTLFEGSINEGVYSSYMTAPNVWRSYFQFMGYLLDNANNRLWVRPKIPSEMGKKIINAALPNAAGWGTLNYDENEKDIKMSISYDSLVTIKELVLKNHNNRANPTLVIINNGQAVTDYTIFTEDWGIEKNIRVKFNTPIQIGTNGLEITSNTQVRSGLNRKSTFPLSITSSSIRTNKPIYFSVNKRGDVSIDLISLNGAKIGTIMRQRKTEGKHSFLWDGKTLEGKKVGTLMGILSLKTNGRTVSKVVFTEINN